MQDSSKFPKPTNIAVNGVELEVFEAGQQNSKPMLVQMAIAMTPGRQLNTVTP